MADINRLSVDTMVLHHAVTPLWENKSKKELAQWFSDNGFARAYGSNSANWSGLINPYTGGRSYSQAHYAGQRVTNKTPDATAAEKKAGYRLVPLVKDPWGQITWHAGHWNTNQRSIGIENLGDYRNYALRDGDCKVIADFWRSRDKALKGKTTILLHNEVYATACPARISEGRGKIVNYVNNPPKPAPVYDNLYRLLLSGKQVAAYSTEKNAYNGYVHYGSTGKITYKGKDVTSALVEKLKPKPAPEKPKPEPEQPKPEEPKPEEPKPEEPPKEEDSLNVFVRALKKFWLALVNIWNAEK